MNKRGFTLVEIIVCVAIISVIGVVIGLNSDKITKTKEEPVSTKIESAAAVYAERNEGVVAPLYDGTDTFINLTVGELLDNGLVDENVLEQEYNGGTITRDTKIVVTLNPDGLLEFDFGSDATYGYLRADNIEIAYGDPYDCDYSINNADILSGSQLIFSDSDGNRITNMTKVSSEGAVTTDNTYWCNIESKRVGGILPLKNGEETRYEIRYVYRLAGETKSNEKTRIVIVKEPLAFTPALKESNFKITNGVSASYYIKSETNKFTIYKESTKNVKFGIDSLNTNYDGDVQLLYKNNNTTVANKTSFADLGVGTHEIKVYPALKRVNNYDSASLEQIENHLTGTNYFVTTTVEIKDAPAVTIKTVEYTDASGSKETLNSTSATANQKEGKKVNVTINGDVPVQKIEYKLDTDTSWKTLNTNTLITTPSKRIKLKVTNKLGMVSQEYTYNFNVVKSIANHSDSNCTAVSGQGCFYKGTQTSNYVSYAGKTWRIFQKDSSNQLHLILDDKLSSQYYFSDYVMYGWCSNDSCCNGGQGYEYKGQSNPYLVPATKEALNNFYTNLSTPKDKIIDYSYKSTYENTNSIIKTYGGLGSLTEWTDTGKVGVMNYKELKNIATCTNYSSCTSSYLNDVTGKWGLGTTTSYNSGTTYFGGTNGRDYTGYSSPHTFYYFYTLGYSSGTLSSVKGDARVYVNQNESRYSQVVATEENSDKTSIYTGEKIYIRPVVVLSSTAKITGGNGTSSYKYTIG